MAKHLSMAAAILAAALSMSTAAFTVSAAEETPDAGTAAVMSLTDGTWETQNGKHYYTLPDGSRAVGETEIDGVYYLFGYSGALKTDWQTVGGKRFYYDPASGTPVFGWIDYFGKRYYVTQEDGKLTGFHHIDGGLYAFCEDGSLQTGLFTMDGTDYCADPVSGMLLAQLVTTENGIYFTDENGIPLHGWQDADGLEYYFDPVTHCAQFGLVAAEDGYYYITPEEGKCYGLTQADGMFYPLDDTTGALVTGWFSAENGTHYFDPETLCMLSGTLAVIDEAVYYFDENGCMTTGWLTLADGTAYYFGEDGTAYCDGLTEIDGVTYYFGETGILHTGWLTLDTQEYYFLEDSAMATGLLTVDGYHCEFDENGVLISKELAQISLEVPSYKQYDEAWENEALGTSTIGNAGCLVTAMAMLHSYSTEAEIIPPTMRDMLTFTGGGSLKSWSDISNLGYTVETYEAEAVTETVLQNVLNRLAESKAVVMGCKNESGGQHYVAITGYIGDGKTLDTSLFTMNDPGSSKRSLLSEFLALFPKLYKLIY